ncbi:hypothetical protein AB0M86_29630 [Streptomyces sp. NPDC051639]
MTHDPSKIILALLGAAVFGLIAAIYPRAIPALTLGLAVFAALAALLV